MVNAYKRILDNIAEEDDSLRNSIPEELLWGLYWGDCYTQKEIAEIFNCGRITIHNRMERYGIPTYWGYRGEVKFSDIQQQILEGCMLGDGSIIKRDSERYPYFQYGDKYLEYHKFIQDVLDIEDVSRVVSCRTVYLLITRRLKELKEEYSCWYPNGLDSTDGIYHKIIPHDLELTTVSMLFWYVGDGCYERRDGSLVFTNHLNKDDAEFLQKEIERVLGIFKGVTIPFQDADKGIHKIRLNKQATGKFFELVKETGFNVPECYWYKFGIGE